MTQIAKYEIIDEIGRGGFGVVYKARDTQMGRKVALKVIRNVPDEPAFIQRFRQEALTAANLRHPRIVTVYDFGDADGDLYLAMALIPGRTLRQMLDERGRLALDEALPVLAQLAEALDHLHGQGLVHRDVKPSNVMLEREAGDLHVTLTDFGLVRSLQASTKLTQTAGGILGTPAYLAPEQADPEQWGEISPLTDVYALGVIAYEMLIGQQPFVGELAAVINAQATKTPVVPLDLVPDLGDDLVDTLLRALTKPPTERYSSASRLVGALREVAEDRAQQERQETELTHLLAQAQTAREADDWLAVQSLCVQAMQIDRAHPDALTMMTEATTALQRESAEEAARRQRARRYEEGLEALDAEQWETAIAAFEEVAQGNPDFREVQDKLAQARDEQQRAQWYSEAIAHGEEKKWAEACRTWLKVLRGRLDYRDGATRLLDAVDGLLGQLDIAKKTFDRQQGDLEQAREALALYDALAAAIELKDWPGAVEVGERLLTLVPDLNRPQAWLARAQGALERLAALDGDATVSEKDGKEMVRIPAGVFLYGDEKQERELPEFWIDRTPVTNAEYARFVDAMDQKPPQHWKDKTPPSEIADHPVVYVSWHDAVAYAEWAGKRLPTEEEWEKAARGTDGRAYPWGDQEPTPKLCNFGNNEGGTTPVGKYSPRGDSPCGCVDMAGNVWEWTSSDYSSERKVLRGGAWVSVPGDVRSANRSDDTPDFRYRNIGFRCVRSPGG